MYGTAPRVILGTNWWNKYRTEVYRSTNYHCNACGVSKYEAKYHQWLEAHEMYDIDYKQGRMTFLKAVPLCHYCHNYIHDGRMRWQLMSGALHHAKYTAIIQHGDAVLAAAGLQRNRDIENAAILKLVAEGGSVRHDEWRLIINAVEYPPRLSLQEIMNQGSLE